MVSGKLSLKLCVGVGLAKGRGWGDGRADVDFEVFVRFPAIAGIANGSRKQKHR